MTSLAKGDICGSDENILINYRRDVFQRHGVS